MSIDGRMLSHQPRDILIACHWGCYVLKVMIEASSRFRVTSNKNWFGFEQKEACSLILYTVHRSNYSEENPGISSGNCFVVFCQFMQITKPIKPFQIKEFVFHFEKSPASEQNSIFVWKFRLCDEILEETLRHWSFCQKIISCLIIIDLEMTTSLKYLRMHQPE